MKERVLFCLFLLVIVPSVIVFSPFVFLQAGSDRIEQTKKPSAVNLHFSQVLVNTSVDPSPTRKCTALYV